jgi:uncharacterized membrane protein YphA (DoxX/SURF4 family)
MGGVFQHVILLLGRVSICLIFLLSAVNKIQSFAGAQEKMADRGLQWSGALLVGAITFELVGGFCVLFGFRARIGALLLIAFLLPVTLVFHNFWNYPEAERPEQMINFLKNLAILGGLLFVLGFGPGAMSLDAMKRR